MTAPSWHSSLLEELMPHGEEGDGQARAEEDDEVGRQLEPAAEIGINRCRRKGVAGFTL